MVNNGSKYRYYVPCGNGAIYGYESTGKPLSGWSPLKGVGVISKPLQRVRNKNVELILAFNNAGRLLLLGSKGEIKWSVDNLPVTKQNFSIVQTGNEFIAMNASGSQLIQISADGNDNIKPLIDTANSFVAAPTSDTSYQYFFSGPHDVRSYNEKSEFKNAISLNSSNVTEIGVISIGDMSYFIAKDEVAKKLMLFDLTLKPIAVCHSDNIYAITLADLFDRKELIAIQPDASGNLTCFRIK